MALLLDGFSSENPPVEEEEEEEEKAVVEGGVLKGYLLFIRVEVTCIGASYKKISSSSSL